MASREAEEPLLSIVAAAYNEEACLRELVARIDRALGGARCRAEFVLVDDGSTDRSFAVIEELAAADPRVRGLRLARNEGHQPALMSGIACARGDVVVTVDADLQHPPERILDMLEAWRRGFDVVHMRRRSGHESPMRAALGEAFYAIFNAVSDVDVSPQSTDFRLIDRRCVEALSREWRRRRFLRAAARRIGFRQTEISFDAHVRFAGSSSYTLRKLFALAGEAVLAAVGRRREGAPPPADDRERDARAGAAARYPIEPGPVRAGSPLR
jgi:glycosyltransferase involved in cell wall biosynthesis